MTTSTPSPLARAPKYSSGCSYQPSWSSTRCSLGFSVAVIPASHSSGDSQGGFPALDNRMTVLVQSGAVAVRRTAMKSILSLLLGLGLAGGRPAHAATTG